MKLEYMAVKRPQLKGGLITQLVAQLIAYLQDLTMIFRVNYSSPISSASSWNVAQLIAVLIATKTRTNIPYQYKRITRIATIYGLSLIHI